MLGINCDAPLDHSGPLDMELRSYGARRLWSYGVMDSWSYGVIGLWSHGVMHFDKLQSYAVMDLCC